MQVVNIEIGLDWFWKMDPCVTLRQAWAWVP